MGTDSRTDRGHQGQTARREGPTSCRSDPPLHRGLTMVELLVVIAVIAILAAFLFPVLSQAREKARQATCMSNLRQLGVAMGMYSEDNDGLFVPALARPSRATTRYSASWMALLEPYTKSRRIYVCPSSGHTSQDYQKDDDLLQNYGYLPTMLIRELSAEEVYASPFGTAYWEGIGGFYGFPIGGFLEDAPSYSHAQIARPEDTVLLCDHKYFDWGVDSLPPGTSYEPQPRHPRGADFKGADGHTATDGIIDCLFVDGHVKGLWHRQLWEIRVGYIHRFSAGGDDVFWHFWPHD